MHTEYSGTAGAQSAFQGLRPFSQEVEVSSMPRAAFRALRGSLVLVALTVLTSGATVPARSAALPNQPRLVLKTPNPVTTLAFSPDGNILASGECTQQLLDAHNTQTVFCGVGRIRLWNTKTGQEIDTYLTTFQSQVSGSAKDSPLLIAL